MNIMVVGAGPAGAYLAYRLRSYIKAGYVDVTVYDKDETNDLGSKCACGIHPPTARDMLPEGTEMIDDNLMFQDDEVVIDAGGYHTTAGFEGATIDKNGFIKELLERSYAEVKYGVRVKHQRDQGIYDVKALNEADLVVDATGVNRALLGKPDNSEEDVLMPCYSHLCTVDREARPMWKPRFKLTTRGTGFIWEFPWCEDTIHVGCGLLEENPKLVLEEYMSDNHLSTISKGEGAAVRLSSPYDVSPKYSSHPPIVGIGEAIGTVSPLSGEGIIPSMECADILFNLMLEKGLLFGEEPSSGFFPFSQYVERIHSNFEEYKLERKVVDSIRDQNLLKAIWHGMGLPDNKILKQSKWSRLRTLIGGVRDAAKRYS